MKFQKTTFILAISVVILLTAFFSAQAKSSSLSVRLRGKILLKVQDKGQAYYLNPSDDKAYYLGRPADALSIMSKLGLGVSEKDYNAFVKNNNTAPQRLAGRILLRVQNKGEAYYIHPTTRQMYFLNRPSDAFNIMRSLGLGISNDDLGKLEVVENNIVKNIDNTNNTIIDLANTPQEIERQQALHYLPEALSIIRTSNECEYLGAVNCDNLNGGIVQCRYYDDDPYLDWDWGHPQLCPPKTACRQLDYKCFPVQDCNKKDFKMAFILLEDSTHPHTQKNLEILNELKKKTAERFAWATRGLGTMNTDHPVAIVKLDGVSDFTNAKHSRGDVVKEFYKTNPDIFDFVTIFTTYDSPEEQFTNAGGKNHIKGIGHSIGDVTMEYGSTAGIFLSAPWIDNINRYEYQDSRGNHPNELDYILGVNGILYETTHQWVGYIDYIDTDGQKKNLMSELNEGVWNKKIDMNLSFSTIMGTFPWIDNGNGTFSIESANINELSKYQESYSDLDLYLMGLLPKEQVKPIKLIETDFPQSQIYDGVTVSGTIKTITIDQIIAAIGKRECAF